MNKIKNLKYDDYNNKVYKSKNKICKTCKKPLMPFKKRKDWKGRDMHIKCWKQEQLFFELSLNANKYKNKDKLTLVFD